MFKKKFSLALDIGSNFMKALVIEGVSKKPKITKFGITPVPSHAIVDGDVMDREVVIDTVKGLLENAGIDETDTITVIPGRGIIVKKITMAKMKPAEAEEQIKWEAEQYIPYGIEDVTLDFEILNPDVGDDKMEVLLVGAKKDVVESRLGLLREAGLNPIVFDALAFAIQNIYEFNYEINSKELVALVHIGAQYTNISFVQGVVNHFTRHVPTAANSFIQSLQREMGVNTDQALEISKGENLEEVDQHTYQDVINNFHEDIAVSIERVLPYLPEGFDKIDRMVLSGGGCLIGNIADYMKDRFKVEVEVLDPFKKIEYNADLLGEKPEKIGPIIAPAMGLAVRGE